jgi:hypothetical protein
MAATASVDRSTASSSLNDRRATSQFELVLVERVEDCIKQDD